MKNFLSFLLVLLVSGTLAQAQTAPATRPMGSGTPPPKMMKADGTPDMRYKENKAMKSAPAAGKLKKDGTPDMRYKANKGKM